MGNNILIISDTDPSRSEETASSLATKGFRVATCSTAEALLRASESDLIIIDRPSPGASFEDCSQLRRAFDIPIVILGKAAGATGWPGAVNSGADLYLAKPLRHRELVARLRAILRRIKWNLGESRYRRKGEQKMRTNGHNGSNLYRILKRQRQSIPLTLRQLSESSGVSSSHLGRIERGERFPSAHILHSIAQPLGFEQSELLALAGYLS
ncbi:helix-turn-helix domain-containing protein, partial [Chloroflexota bacterium]